MDQEIELLKNIFGSEGQPIGIMSFLIQILLTTILSLIISYVYVRYGNALSNRKALSRTFVSIALTTMIIITIVKSSLALSLGLVGALSIVRFRTAIKEPEELAYFFMMIAIGLGIGAGQILVTIIGTISLAVLTILINRKKPKEVIQNLLIRFQGTDGVDINTAIDLLKDRSLQLELKRLEEDADGTEVAFAVSFEDYQDLLSAKDELKQKYPQLSFSFLEIV